MSSTSLSSSASFSLSTDSASIAGINHAGHPQLVNVILPCGLLEVASSCFGSIQLHPLLPTLSSGHLEWPVDAFVHGLNN